MYLLSNSGLLLLNSCQLPINHTFCSLSHLLYLRIHILTIIGQTCQSPSKSGLFSQLLILALHWAWCFFQYLLVILSYACFSFILFCVFGYCVHWVFLINLLVKVCIDVCLRQTEQTYSALFAKVWEWLIFFFLHMCIC